MQLSLFFSTEIAKKDRTTTKNLQKTGFADYSRKRIKN